MSISTDIDIAAEKHGGNFQSQQASRRNLLKDPGAADRTEVLARTVAEQTPLEAGAGLPGLSRTAIDASAVRPSIKERETDPFRDKPDSFTFNNYFLLTMGRVPTGTLPCWNPDGIRSACAEIASRNRNTRSDFSAEAGTKR